MRLFNVISKELVVEESRSSAKIQSVYSTALADWAMNNWLQDNYEAEKKL